MRTHLLPRVALFVAVIALGLPARAEAVDGDVSVRDLGARGDGKTLDTRAIQAAIDRCAAGGGGRVVVPAGRYVACQLKLKSHVELHLSPGAAILGSPHLADYLDGQTPPPSRKSKQPIPRGLANPNHPLYVIGADDADDVSITGSGTIDGSGASPEFDRGDNDPFRPRILLFTRCRDVLVRDVTLRDSAMWVQYYRGCRRVRISGERVFSHANLNNDGLDIDSRDVNVSDCVIDCDDDGICLKSDGTEPCQDVTVSNCVVGSNCNAIKFGTASRGGFINVAVSNCTIRPASEHRQRAWKDGISGLALEMVDGGVMDRVAVSNLAMSGVQTPIFIRLGARSHPGQEALRDVVISNITASSDSPLCSSITGIPGAAAAHIKLSHLIFACPGVRGFQSSPGGTAAMAGRAVPENERGYPENRMFGPSLPAYGLYVRHVADLTLDDVEFRLQSADARPAMVFDDVHGLRLTQITMDPPTPPPGKDAADCDLMTFDRSTGVYLAACSVGQTPGVLVFSPASELNGVRLTRAHLTGRPPGPR